MSLRARSPLPYRTPIFTAWIWRDGRRVASKLLGSLEAGKAWLIERFAPGPDEEWGIDDAARPVFLSHAARSRMVLATCDRCTVCGSRDPEAVDEALGALCTECLDDVADGEAQLDLASALDAITDEDPDPFS